MFTDTIAAIATPVGEGGIGIIRISGTGALPIAQKSFRSKTNKDLNKVPTHTLHYGHVIDGQGEEIDEVLLAVMRSPHSFTTEDVVEIHGHGGTVLLHAILERLIQLGARMAEPGEFTKRAFLGGRLDLAQSEAVVDLIRAKTQLGARASLRQLSGNLSRQIGDIRRSILEILAFIEANIDFPEEDLEEMSQGQVIDKTEKIIEQLAVILNRAATGKILREGLNTAIIGKPNVGKSSLLNTLLREQRAIVTDVPGTTRDTIEEYVDLDGVPLKLIDTAGIRETNDIVERIGVEKSREVIRNAELILLVLDGSKPLDELDRELLRMIAPHNTIILVNKMDLGRVITDDEIFALSGQKPIYSISAWTEDNLSPFIDRVRSLVADGSLIGDREPLIQNARQIQCLEHSMNHLREVLGADLAVTSLDMLSIDLREAWETLGQITGETAGEDLLDQIFSQFCIGK